jgi:hypothetical protein
MVYEQPILKKAIITTSETGYLAKSRAFEDTV